MRNRRSSDRSIIAVSLLCVFGLLFVGQWVSHRPMPRIAPTPTPPVPVVIAPPTPAPTPTPRPTLGPLSIAARKPMVSELVRNGSDPERVLVPVLKVHPWNRIESQRWSVVKCWWSPKADGKWQLYKGANPPWPWCPGDAILRSRKMQPAYLYAPIGRWKLSIQLDMDAHDTFNIVRKRASCTVVLDVTAKTRKWDPLPKVPLEVGTDGKPLPRTDWLQYRRDGGKWHDAPRAGEAGFPLFVEKDMMLSFRAVQLVPDAPQGRNIKVANSTYWRSPSFDEGGPGEITVGFDQTMSHALYPVSAMRDALETYVCVLPPEYS